MRTNLIVACLGLLLTMPARAQTAPHPIAPPSIAIVAAENFYGDVAGQIGGPGVRVTSILSNPDQDPHLFEASPSVARALSAARIVVYNGIDYDPWMAKLLGAARSGQRRTIVVADLVGRKTGDNPHIWYDPATMLACAKAVAAALAADDPTHKADYDQRLARFTASIAPIQARIAALRQRLAGTPVTATEPVFGYMFEAMGMQVRNLSFQLAVMNGTEPSASDVAAFETDLRTHAVKLLVYNAQAADPIAQRMERLARASHIPVVGAAETEPQGKTYQSWMLSELDAVANALPPPR
jgi:zinc/manganese transport system substrate-binding protein